MLLSPSGHKCAITDSLCFAAAFQFPHAQSLPLMIKLTFLRQPFHLIVEGETAGSAWYGIPFILLEGRIALDVNQGVR